MRKNLLYLLVFILASSSACLSQSAGNFILYGRTTSPNGSIWIKNSQGVDSMLLPNGYRPRISTNSLHFLYMKNTTSPGWNYSGQWMRHDMVTNSDTAILNNNNFITGYDFLNSDSNIVAAFDCGIYTYKYNGQGISQVPSVGSCYNESPDIRQTDSLLVWDNNDANSLYTEQLPSGSPAPIPFTNINAVYPAWSPDGRWILFSTYANSFTLEGRLVNFYKIKADGDSLTQLTFNDTATTGPYTAPAVWINNGTQLLTAGFINSVYRFIAISTDGSGVATALNTVDGDTINLIAVTPATQLSLITDVAEIVKQDKINLFPNPVTTSLTVQRSDYNIQGIEVIDLFGQIVYSTQLGNSSLQHKTTLDFSNLTQGVYFVNVRDENGKLTTGKFIKM